MISRYISFYRSQRGMSLFSLLVTLTLFGGIFLAVTQWEGWQRKSAVEIYQRFQAIQIAENQKQRLFLGLECQADLTQNGTTFNIRCNGDAVKVGYPRGEINL